MTDVAGRRGFSRVVVVLLIATGCTSGPQTSIHTPSPAPVVSPPTFGTSDVPTIAFHSDPDGRDDTYVMREDGTSVVAVTDGEETVARPYWSPDGARLVVSCCTSGFGGHLFLLEGPGSAAVELAPGVAGAASPAWSPDGSTIVFESIDDRSLYEVDVSGAVPGTPHPLGLSGAGPSWSPDGQRIAYFADHQGEADIYTAAADGTDVVRLTRNEAPDHSPVWSSDGRILFVSERGGDQDIYVMEADGSGQLDVSRNPWPDDSPVTTPGPGRCVGCAVEHRWRA